MNEMLLTKMFVVQKSEITEHYFYRKIASFQKIDNTKNLLNHIADVEMNHYRFWKNFTNKEVTPNKLRVFYYSIIVLIFGLTFGVRLMEKKQRKIKTLYEELHSEISGIDEILADENEHEKMHIDEIDEERLKYISSIVLGLNDALVEFTGAIAGFTFALARSELIALAGLIAGISASLSMASSEYLATKQETNHHFALISAIYTGVAYLIAVILMIIPYLLIDNLILCLIIMIGIVVLIILIFNYYISVAKQLSFKRRFWEMTLISLSVASLSFVIGIVVRNFFGIEI